MAIARYCILLYVMLSRLEEGRDANVFNNLSVSAEALGDNSNMLEEGKPHLHGSCAYDKHTLDPKFICRVGGH